MRKKDLIKNWAKKAYSYGHNKSCELINNAEIGYSACQKNDEVFLIYEPGNWGKPLTVPNKKVTEFTVRIAARLLTGGTFDEEA